MASLLRLCLILLVTAWPGIASASSMKILGGGAVQPMLRPMGPELKARTGADVEMVFGVVGGLQKRLSDGEKADLVVLPQPMLAALETSGKVKFAKRFPLARAGVAVVVAAGATPLPDVSTSDAVGKLLARAKSIAHPDPKLTPSGAHFAKLFGGMGLLAAGGPRIIHRNAIDGGVKLVASGEAEIGLYVVTEVLAETGVRVAGMLPAEFQSWVVYGVGVVAGTGSEAAAGAVADHLLSPALAERWKAAGFELVRAP